MAENTEPRPEPVSKDHSELERVCDEICKLREQNAILATALESIAENALSPGVQIEAEEALARAGEVE